MLGTIYQLKALVLGGLGLWMLVAVWNNIVDRGTNVFLIGRMTSMEELRLDGNLGKGLVSRAVMSKAFPRLVLGLIVIYQMMTSALLLIAAYLLLVGAPNDPSPLAVANIAISFFCALWMGFLTGGLYFGYWIKMAHVQQVHLALLMISILTMGLINL